MELDDLKQLWNQAPLKTTKNTDIMDIIKHKTYGPLASLKAVYRKQILVMCVIPILLLMTNLEDLQKPLTSVLFWSYIAFCSAMIVFARYNYRTVSNMAVMDDKVRANLSQQINVLEKRARLEIIVLRAVLLFFIALVEIVPYFQHYRMLDKWHSLPGYARVSAYAGLILLQFFLNRKIKQRKIGRHLDYLKELVNELN
jgi:hypothetical protein